MVAGAALSLGRLVTAAQTRSPNDTIQVAVIGMGDTKAVGGVGGRGHQLIPRLLEVPGVKIVALCDVDPSFIDRELAPFKKRGESPATYNDLRRVFEDKSIDAVVLAVPNHWHALATVWACQAGKDVYVEKPFCYDLWEGQQMLAAARKHGRMLQVGTQNRASKFLARTFDYLHGGDLGAIRFAHALVYRPREGIGNVTAPTQPPAGVDYDLWCGPAPKGPLMRKQLNYEWHWFWDTGNGEMGNNGIHVIDICRWALSQNSTPPRTISIGGRLGFNDCGQTANTHIGFFDYQPAPLICEVRNLSTDKKGESIGSYRDRKQGVIIDCEGGYFAGDAAGGAIFDKEGKKMKELTSEETFNGLETAHLTSFAKAVRSRNAEDLTASGLEGYRSTACCHLANVSHRLGKQLPADEIQSSVKSSVELSDAFERCRAYLKENGVDLATEHATLGPWVSFDSARDRFVQDFAKEANKLSHRSYRKPFVVPHLA